MSCPLPFTWVMLHMWWQGEFSAFFPARAETSGTLLSRVLQGALSSRGFLCGVFSAVGLGRGMGEQGSVVPLLLWALHPDCEW